MQRYFADILTAIRLGFTVALFVITATGGSLGVGFLLFVLGELTDAFDGACAMRWPFPKNKTPKYRKYAAKYDMVVDISLALTMELFFLIRVNWVGGVIIGVGYPLAAVIIDFIVYGKLLGHPDDYTKRSLAAHNFPLAKKIILARRRVYVSLIALVAAWTLYASDWDMVAKTVTTVIAVAISIFLWFFLAQRRRNISRDAVKIEKKLEK